MYNATYDYDEEQLIETDYEGYNAEQTVIINFNSEEDLAEMIEQSYADNSEIKIFLRNSFFDPLEAYQAQAARRFNY